VILENKILAGDQEDQLDRYYRYAASLRGYSDDQILMFYLTLDGHAPSSFSLDPAERLRMLEAQVLVEISYRAHITGWLEAVLPDVKAPAVAEVIRQYVKTLRSLVWR